MYGSTDVDVIQFENHSCIAVVRMYQMTLYSFAYRGLKMKYTFGIHLLIVINYCCDLHNIVLLESSYS